MTLHDNAVAVLTRWEPPSAAQAGLRAAYLGHLAAHPDGLSRSCNPDHLTASMIVLSADRERVLLDLHRRYEIWVQFGGHCEGTDETLAAAALRETVEESRIADLAPLGTDPVQLSRHEVRCGPLRPAHHLDVQYAALAPAGAVAQPSAESLDVRWFDVDALPDGLGADVVELIALARALPH